MKQWLKFFGLSFFSDGIAKGGARRSIANSVLAIIISLAFFFCGALASDLVPFYAHLSSAEDFNGFINNAVEKLDLTLEKGILSAGGKIVDTFGNEEDEKVFSVNGYKLVADMRPANAFDKFNAYAVLNDGTKVEYTEFISRPDASNLNYKFTLEYTNEELVLTEELTKEHELFLDSYKNENSQLPRQYTQVKEKKGTLSAEEYASQVYTLYVKAVYPDLSAYEPSGGAPKLRNFYYHNYIEKGAKDYLLLFSDTLTGSFTAGSGQQISFYGYYAGMADGAVENGGQFITQAFNGTTGVSVYMYAMNVIRFIPYLVLAPVIIALLAFCILRLFKVEWCRSFGSAFKVTASFLMFSSLIGALCTFICGYFAPRNSLFMLGLGLYFGVLLVRCAVLVIRDCITAKKNKDNNTEILPEEVGNDTVRG